MTDKDLDDTITRLYLTGLSTAQVARKVGMETQFVRTSLERTNTPRRQGRSAHTTRPVINLRLAPERR